MGCVYKLSFPNGKAYIGITTRNMEDRWKRHVYCSKNKKYQQPVHRAINKYGVDNVKISFLHNDVEGDLLQSLEIEEIRAAKANGQTLYNMTIGGDGIVGYVLTEEDREKLSASLIGNQRTKGRKWPEEERLKRAENRKPISEETRRKLCAAVAAREPRRGFIHSDETKAKMSAKRKGEFNGRAILDAKQVAQIKVYICQDFMLKDIAEIYKVSSGLISRICTDKVWSHVPWPLDVPSRDD